MTLPITVIALSWLLNALMDAIDHGKGAQTLGTLWHILKWFSYALPFGYIMWLTHMPIYLIIILCWALFILWEMVYRFLRHINFHTLD